MPRTVTPRQIENAARAAGIDPRLYAALIRQESGGRADARSPAGALGPAQLMPDTARGLGVNPDDPDQNLLGGARYLRQQLDRFKRPDLALSAYNSGPGGAESSGRVEAFPETQNYVRRILGSLGSTAAPASASLAIGAAHGPRQPPSTTPSPAQPDLRRQLARELLRQSQETARGRQPDYTGFLGLAAEAQRQRATASAPSPTAMPEQARATVAPTAAGAGAGGADLMRRIIAEAQRRKLVVRENPLVDKVDNVHTEHSDHYRTFKGTNVGAGADVSGGTPEERIKFALWVMRQRGVKDVFHDPLGYSLDNGRRWDKTIGGHDEHVHVSAY